MSEWREFEKFVGFDFPVAQDTSSSEINVHAQYPVFEGKLSVRKDMVGAFGTAHDPECELTRVFFKFGDSVYIVKCSYPEFYDWVTK